MRFLRVFGAILLLLILILGCGDFLNLPLWPLDLLKTSYPVELQFQLAGFNPEETLKMFGQSIFSEVYLCKDDGTRIRPLQLDQRGVSRFVIEEGVYRVEATVTSIRQQELFLFVQRSSDTGALPEVKTQFSGQVFPVTLDRQTELETQSKSRILSVYLQKGDLHSARIVAEKISAETCDDIDRLIQLSQELDALDVDAYNSIVIRLKEAGRLFSQYGIPVNDQIIQLPSDTLHIDSRLNAVQNARFRVIESYIEVMTDFYQSGRLMSVLQEWNQLVTNPELFTSADDLPASMQQALTQFESVVAEVQQMLPEEIESNFQQGVALYEEGNLLEARKKLSRLLSFMRNLNLREEHEDIDTAVVEYLQDIEIITTANHAIRSDDLEKALMLFDLIARPNKLVHERIRETRRFMQIRSGKAVD